MVRLDRIYTRTGDKGTTRLTNGQQVGKDDLRVEAYGTLDELNSIIGLARSFNRLGPPGNVEACDRIEAILATIQRRLFVVGAELATPIDVEQAGLPAVTDSDVETMEGWIDSLNEDLKPLDSFLLPGGGQPLPGFLHQARTVCRRAERVCVRVMGRDGLRPVVLKYMNRLSDVLFVLARWAAVRIGDTEILWEV